MSDELHRVSWLPREPPLTAGALFAPSTARRALLSRLRAADRDATGDLRGLAGPAGIFVKGPAAALPWVDGAVYLARIPGSSGLWLPTTRRPDVSIDLYERAVRRRVRRARGELAVVPGLGFALALFEAAPLDERWFAHAEADAGDD